MGERHYGLEYGNIALINGTIYVVDKLDMTDNNRCYIKDIKNMDKEAQKMTCEEVSMHKVDKELYKLDLNGEIKPEWIKKIEKTTAPYQLQQIQEEIIFFGLSEHCLYFADQIEGADTERLLDRVLELGLEDKKHALDFAEKNNMADSMPKIISHYEELEKENQHVDEDLWKKIEEKFGLEGMSAKEAIDTISKWKEKADIYDLVQKTNIHKPKKVKKKNITPSPS